MHHWIWICIKIAVLTIIGVISVGSISFFWLWTDAKAEVDNTPKVPMLDCPKHGFFPKSAALFIEPEGQGQKEFPMCPFCFHENLSNVDERLKHV